MSSKCIIVSVGFNNEINLSRVLTILNPSTVAAKKLVTEARADSMLLDVTMGRKARSVILFDNHTVMLSALNPQTIMERGEDDCDTAKETEAVK